MHSPLSPDLQTGAESRRDPRLWQEALCPLPLTVSHLPPPPLQAGSAPTPHCPASVSSIGPYCLASEALPVPPLRLQGPVTMGWAWSCCPLRTTVQQRGTHLLSLTLLPPHVQHPVGGLQAIDPCLPPHPCSSSSGLASGRVSTAPSPSLCPHGHLLTSQCPSGTSPMVSTRNFGNTCLIISFQATLTCFEALKTFLDSCLPTGFSQSCPSPPGKAMHPTFLLPHPHMNTHVPTRAPMYPHVHMHV